MWKVAVVATPILFMAAFGITGCATAAKTYNQDGRVGYAINCSGAVNSWGKCYEKAGETCGTKGYDILSRAGDQGSTISGNQFGVYGGSVITRDLVIACKP